MPCLTGGHLPELNGLEWYDIMRLAAYVQYNPMIPHGAPICDGATEMRLRRTVDVSHSFGRLQLLRDAYNKRSKR